MRSHATSAERNIRDSIAGYLNFAIGEAWTFDSTIADRPDIVVETASGVRIGIEIAWFVNEQFMKWLSFRTPVDSRREAAIHIDVGRMIHMILKVKNQKYHDYRRARKLNQVWLCLHNDLIAFATPDSQPGTWRSEDFAIDVAFSCREYSCKFDQVLYFMDLSKTFLHVFEKIKRAQYTRHTTIKPVLHFSEMVGIAKSEGLHFDISMPAIESKTFGSKPP